MSAQTLTPSVHSCLLIQPNRVEPRAPLRAGPRPYEPSKHLALLRDRINPPSSHTTGTGGLAKTHPGSPPRRRQRTDISTVANVITLWRTWSPTIARNCALEVPGCGSEMVRTLDPSLVALRLRKLLWPARRAVVRHGIAPSIEHDGLLLGRR